MSQSARSAWYIVIAIIIISAAFIYFYSAGKKFGAASLPSEYRGSAISATAPSGIPAALIPSQAATQEVYYSNPQSAGGSYDATQTIASLASFYRSGFAALDWTLESDVESPDQAFLSAHESDGSAAMVTLVQLPGGVVRVHLAMQK